MYLLKVARSVVLMMVIKAMMAEHKFKSLSDVEHREREQKTIILSIHIAQLPFAHQVSF